MIIRNKSLRKRIQLWLHALSVLVCSTSGCGLPHGTYQGDPMLGNFNRPIAPSPPVYAGGDPGMGPGYDGGARLGMNSPDVPDPTSASSTSKASWLVPTYSFKGGLLGLRGSGGGGGGSGSGAVSTTAPTTVSGKQPANSGARLRVGDDSKKPLLAIANIPPDATSVTFRSPEPNTLLMSGSAIVPPGPAKDRPVVAIYDRSKDPVRITTVEEGQVILASYGIRWQRLEQTENGEWLFTCSKCANPNGTADRRYESRNADQVTAVRNVIEQVKFDK